MFPVVILYDMLTILFAQRFLVLLTSFPLLIYLGALMLWVPSATFIYTLLLWLLVYTLLAVFVVYAIRCAPFSYSSLFSPALFARNFRVVMTGDGRYTHVVVPL